MSELLVGLAFVFAAIGAVLWMITRDQVGDDDDDNNMGGW